MPTTLIQAPPLLALRVASVHIPNDHDARMVVLQAAGKARVLAPSLRQAITLLVGLLRHESLPKPKLPNPRLE